MLSLIGPEYSVNPDFRSLKDSRVSLLRGVAAATERSPQARPSTEDRYIRWAIGSFGRRLGPQNNSGPVGQGVAPLSKYAIRPRRKAKKLPLFNFHN